MGMSAVQSSAFKAASGEMDNWSYRLRHSQKQTAA